MQGNPCVIFHHWDEMYQYPCAFPFCVTIFRVTRRQAQWYQLCKTEEKIFRINRWDMWGRSHINPYIWQCHYR